MIHDKQLPNTLREFHKLNEERVIAEGAAALILEKLNKDDLKEASKILKKLSAIKKVCDTDKNLAPLGNAIKQAADEVNDFTGGGLKALFKKGVAALQKLFGAKAGENPILKAMTLLSALETGFADLETVISNNLPEFDDKGESLLSQAGSNAKAKKNIAKNMLKAFEPEGIYGKMKSLFGASGGGIPYVKNVKSLVTGIMKAPAPVVTSLIKAATEGEGAKSFADNIQKMDKDGGGGEGKEGAVPEKASSPVPVKTVSGLAQSVAGAAAASKGDEVGSKTAAAAEANPKKVAQKLIKHIAKNSNQSPEVVEKVLNVLLKKGRLKTTFNVTEGRAKDTKVVTLKMADVVDAQMALLKCGKSTNNWLKILFEEVTQATKSAKKTPAKKTPAKKTPAKKTADPAADTAVDQAKSSKKNATDKKGKQDKSATKNADPATDTAADRAQSSKPDAAKTDTNTDVKKTDNNSSESSEESGKIEFLKALQKDLDGIDTKTIEAVLDAIPEFLRVEAWEQFTKRIEKGEFAGDYFSGS